MPSERSFDEPIITIGSDEAATLSLDDPAIAPEHAIILSEDGHQLFINRADGTRLNGEILMREARRPLAHGDTLGVGPYLISIALDEDARRPLTSELEADRDAVSLQSDARRKPEAATPPEESAAATTNASQSERQAGSFAAILDSLRTEEDSFYFEVVGTTLGRQRVSIESSEMPVGWGQTGREISCDSTAIAIPRAVVRKDWSGVVVQPSSPGAVAVNDEPVETTRRLRNGDRLTLRPGDASASPEENFLLFHEPATLIVLDSLLPQRFPPPVSPVAEAEAGGPETRPETDPPAVHAAATAPHAGLFSPDRRYFGFFTFAEIVVMMLGTLVAAAIIFLILEYS